VTKTRTDHAYTGAPAGIHDVLIVGGGFVGGTLAVALAQAGLSVVLVEATDWSRLPNDASDGRASAISLSSRRLFEAIGFWPRVIDGASPMLDIRVADGSSPFFLHYDHREVGTEPFGHLLENGPLLRAVVAAVRDEPNVTVLTPARVVRLHRSAAGVDASLADGGRVRARLAVAADGRNSPTREDAGIGVSGWRYGQTAIVCTVAHDHPHGHIAHEHFLPAGPFAILPLLGNRSSIVWTERADLAPAILALGADDFLSELARRFGDFLGGLEVVGRRWSYPLSLQFAWRATARRLVLVGDALHAMHPIAGQGLNMGLRDVAALVDVLTEARDRGRDLGDRDVLVAYERRRRFDNVLMLAATDGLNRLFSNDIPPIRMARDLGLAAVDRMPALKRLFMRHAMGVVGELPTLMRGQDNGLQGSRLSPRSASAVR
jgi:2-octaprenyl-6-methoxyphenol hydroxylase